MCYKLAMEQLSVENRQIGKRWSRALRRKRRVPAIVYGPKVDNMAVSVSQIELDRYAHHKFDNSIFLLKSQDKKIDGLQVLKKMQAINPATHIVNHIDFYALDMSKNVRIRVEVRFTGKAEGEKEGGVFSAILRDVEVECLPSKIPPFVEVDVSHLKLNDSLHVSDLKMPAEVKLLTAPENTLATVADIKEEVAAPTPAEGAAQEGDEAAKEGEAAKTDDNKKETKKEGK